MFVLRLDPPTGGKYASTGNSSKVASLLCGELLSTVDEMSPHPTHTHTHTHTHYRHGKQALGTQAEPAAIMHTPSYRHPWTASLLHKGKSEPGRKGGELHNWYLIDYTCGLASDSQAIPGHAHATNRVTVRHK